MNAGQLELLMDRYFPILTEIPIINEQFDILQEFGENAVSVGFSLNDRVEFDYVEGARWAYWGGFRFRTENDAVEFKLRFG